MKATLLDQAQRLPVQERIELVEAIWDTVAEDASPEALPVSAAHRRELDKRLADLQENPDTGRSWEEIRARLERGQKSGAANCPESEVGGRRGS